MDTVQAFPREPIHTNVVALTGVVQELKDEDGVWVGGNVSNGNASTVFLQVFDLPQASVTLGTTTPVYSEAIPASTAYRVGDGYPVFCAGNGTVAGISVAITTTRTGSTSPGAACSCSFRWQ